MVSEVSGLVDGEGWGWLRPAGPQSASKLEHIGGLRPPAYTAGFGCSNLHSHVSQLIDLGWGPVLNVFKGSQVILMHIQAEVLQI